MTWPNMWHMISGRRPFVINEKNGEHHKVTEEADAQQTLCINGPTVWYVCCATNLFQRRKHKEEQQYVDWYRQASTRLEHLKRVDNPLVVRPQQRADVLPRGIAQPLGHAGPAPFFTDHLEASFICHNLEHKGKLLVKICEWRWLFSRECS